MAQVVVPFMALVYVVTVLIILLTHLGEIPAALATIVQSAFGLRAAAGGTLGAILVAMQKGIARGIFSNEAGLGSAPIAAATAKTDEPVAQGLVSMMGTVIDTLIICTMTGLSIIITDTWNIGLDGVDVTTRAFQIGLPFPERVSSFLLMLCLVFLHLQRSLAGIITARNVWNIWWATVRGVKMLSLAVYSGGIDRTVYDRVGSLDDCGYF